MESARGRPRGLEQVLAELGVHAACPGKFPAICLQKGFLDSRPGQRRANGKRAARVQLGVAQRCNRPGSARIGQERDLARDFGELLANFSRSLREMGFGAGAIVQELSGTLDALQDKPELIGHALELQESQKKTFPPAICLQRGPAESKQSEKREARGHSA